LTLAMWMDFQWQRQLCSGRVPVQGCLQAIDVLQKSLFA